MRAFLQAATRLVKAVLRFLFVFPDMSSWNQKDVWRFLFTDFVVLGGLAFLLLRSVQ